MRIFAVSDVHVDYRVNKDWLLNLSSQEYRDDVLILAGDLTDNLGLLEQCLGSLSMKFRQVLFVPGNHELWVIRDEIPTSFEKFEKTLEVSAGCGVSTDVFVHEGISIVPLFGWYDFSFGAPCEKIRDGWSDFRACVWADGFGESEITDYFLSLNAGRLACANRTVISFSHFLPRIDLMPSFVHPSKRYIYPVLGSERLGDQVSTLNPSMHVYGHSHVNQRTEIDGTCYINNAFGYPSETRIAKKRLMCIHEG